MVRKTEKCGKYPPVYVPYMTSHGWDILAHRQNFVVGLKKWIFVYRILCWIQKAKKKEGL